jgi:hypothetical protein
VADRVNGRVDVRALLDAVEDAPPVAAADVIGMQLAEALDATEVAFLIADLSGEALVRLAHAGDPAATRTQGRETGARVPLRDSPQGRALRDQAVQVSEKPGGFRLHAPVTNRGEAIGVLEVTLPASPGEQELAAIALVAHVLAYVVIANRRFTDLFEWGQRSVPLSLAAEIQHRLLPAASTCEAGQFTLAGWLEPAGEIAGDTYDFALERDVLHVSMTDAMGHALPAAVLATVLVGALRNGRRAGVSLAEQARRASEALHEHSGGSEFVTGQLVRIDLRSGTAAIVNAGHPAPLRLRGGTVEEVELAADPPFGVLASWRRTSTASSPCRSSRATASCSSRTGSSSATRPASTSRSSCGRRRHCTRARPCRAWSTGSSRRRAAASWTTRPSSAWTGTEARPVIARRARARTSSSATGRAASAR